MTSVNQVAFYLFIIHRNGYCGCNYSCCFSCCWFDQVVAWICQAIKIVQVSNIDWLYIDWINFLTEPIRQSQLLFLWEFWSGMCCCLLHWLKFNRKSLKITKINALTLPYTCALDSTFFGIFSTLPMGILFREVDGSWVLEWSQINKAFLRRPQNVAQSSSWTFT